MRPLHARRPPYADRSSSRSPQVFPAASGRSRCTPRSRRCRSRQGPQSASCPSTLSSQSSSGARAHLGGGCLIHADQRPVDARVGGARCDRCRSSPLLPGSHRRPGRRNRRRARCTSAPRPHAEPVVVAAQVFPAAAGGSRCTAKPSLSWSDKGRNRVLPVDRRRSPRQAARAHLGECLIPHAGRRPSTQGASRRRTRADRCRSSPLLPGSRRRPGRRNRRRARCRSRRPPAARWTGRRRSRRRSSRPAAGRSRCTPRSRRCRGRDRRCRFGRAPAARRGGQSPTRKKYGAALAFGSSAAPPVSSTRECDDCRTILRRERITCGGIDCTRPPFGVFRPGHRLAISEYEFGRGSDDPFPILHVEKANSPPGAKEDGRRDVGYFHLEGQAWRRYGPDDVEPSPRLRAATGAATELTAHPHFQTGLTI